MSGVSEIIVKDQRGGRRTGAGRRKGYRAPSTVLAGEARGKTIEKILKYWDPILNTLITEGLGEYYIETYETDKDGKQKRVIRKAKPNLQALYNLVEMVNGKPNQKIEHDGTIEMPAIQALADNVKAILERRKEVTPHGQP